MKERFLVSATALATLLCGASPVFAETTAQTMPQTLPPNYTEGVPTMPLTIQPANNANNTAPAEQPNGIANPTPGSIVVHLNGRVLFAPVAEWSSLDTFKATPTSPPDKLSHFANVGYVRLYPGVDAVATNGLRYGASVEIRQDFGPSPDRQHPAADRPTPSAAPCSCDVRSSMSRPIMSVSPAWDRATA